MISTIGLKWECDMFLGKDGFGDIRDAKSNGYGSSAVSASRASTLLRDRVASNRLNATPAVNGHRRLLKIFRYALW